MAARTSRWRNRNDEDRNRCRATETRQGTVRQCSEDRREQHTHQWRGVPFADQEQPNERPLPTATVTTLLQSPNGRR